MDIEHLCWLREIRVTDTKRSFDAFRSVPKNLEAKWKSSKFKANTVC